MPTQEEQHRESEAHHQESAGPVITNADADASHAGQNATPAGSGDLLFTFIIFVVAVIPRLYVAMAWAKRPVWDGYYYDFGALRLAAGLGYSDNIYLGGQWQWHPWCHYPVGYSGFLGLVYKIFGDDLLVAPIANAIIGAVLVMVVHRLARHVVSPVRARLAAALAALSPGLILYAALVMTEPLAALGVIATPWLFVRDIKTRPVRGTILAGLTLGLTTLVRPQTLLCAPALMLLGLGTGHFRNHWKGAVKVTATTALVSLLVVAPWTIRNCRVMDGCTLVSSNAGWNLVIGSFPRATGRFETVRASDGCPVVSGQSRQDRCWMNQGLKYIVADPVRWLNLIPKKLSFTFDHESFQIGYLAEADPSAWPEARKASGRMVLTGSYLALLSLAAFSVVSIPVHRRWRDRIVQAFVLMIVLALVLYGALGQDHFFWPIAIAIPLLSMLPLPGKPSCGGIVGYLAFTLATVVVTHAVFFGEDRYHIVVTPVLCILAACALRRRGSTDRFRLQSMT